MTAQEKENSSLSGQQMSNDDHLPKNRGARALVAAALVFLFLFIVVYVYFIGRT